jgi:hypothetical protein
MAPRHDFPPSVTSNFSHHRLFQWRLKVNINKTEAILFTKRRPAHPAPLRLEGSTIPWASEDTYLGLWLTPTLKYSTHIKRLAGTALGNLIKIFPLLAKDSTLSTSTKLLLYTTSIRSTLSYAAPVWCSVSDSTYQQLQIVQNKCLRVITNSPRRTPIFSLHASLGVDYLRTYILHIAARFYAQCQSHTNPLIGAVGRYDLSDLHSMYKRYKHKRPKHALL